MISAKVQTPGMGGPMARHENPGDLEDIQRVYEVLHLVSREEREVYRWDPTSPLEDTDPDLVVMTRLSNSSRPFPVRE